MTVEKCLSTCTLGNFALAGVEFGRECYCGNGILYAYGSSQSCSMACSGNPAEICGGPNAINIYATGIRPYTVGPASVVSGYAGWQVTQCWQDDIWPFGGRRILPHHPGNPIPAEEMTVEGCINGCSASAYTSAGVEYGQECWCGNVTYPPGQSTSMYECDKPCLGNAAEICGGSNRIVIYTNL